MSYVVVQIVVFLLIAGGLGFVAGWMLRGWGLDGSTRMGDGYEREQRQLLLRELNTARAERDDARTQMLAMRAAIPCAAASTLKRDRSVPAPAQAAPSPQPRPVASARARSSATVGETDDLKRIKGVGPKLEQTLHAMGITRFAQIAAWSVEDVHNIDANLRFPGRIERERWIEQARKFAAE